MATIKLLNIGTVLDGVIRLQSQLQVGTDTAGYILENGVLKSWGNGDKGFNFYPTDISYEIVTDKKDMNRQAL